MLITGEKISINVPVPDVLVYLNDTVFPAANVTKNVLDIEFGFADPTSV